MSVAILFILFIAIIGLSSTILWIWALIDVARNQKLDTNNRILWVLIIVILPFIGSLVYLIVGRNQERVA
jgi:hypothetical protein